MTQFSEGDCIPRDLTGYPSHRIAKEERGQQNDGRRLCVSNDIRASAPSFTMPRCDPWGWPIYLQDWVVLEVNVGT